MGETAKHLCSVSLYSSTATSGCRLPVSVEILEMSCSCTCYPISVDK